jgi:hypothetical protein
MPRLPVPKQDDGVWGDLLNEFILAERNADGSLKTVAIGKGGTGATDAETARTNLGAASAAELSAHQNSTTSVHGIADTATLETIAGAQAKVDAHINDSSTAHAASAMSFTPTGSIAAADEIGRESGM